MRELYGEGKIMRKKRSVFKSLSDDTRIKIIDILKNGSLTFGEIKKEFELTDATVSYHLSVLEDAGIISKSKWKNYVYYSLKNKDINHLLNEIEKVNDYKT